jgi:hypothetical protein
MACCFVKAMLDESWLICYTGLHVLFLAGAPLAVVCPFSVETTMDHLAVQYLEDGPGIAHIVPADAQARLHLAFERVPLSDVLVGWNLPESLIRVCVEETNRASARLYRWHPLLTGDGTSMPRSEWQSVGLGGTPVSGFQDMPEFTFVCPNRPVVRAGVLDHLRELCASGLYQGIFLDRIRYPSPAQDPAVFLACFCEDCCRVAAAEDFDLDAARRSIGELLSSPEGAQAAVNALLDCSATDAALTDPNLASLHAFLDFRARTVFRFVQEASRVIRKSGLEVGLDCFSPCLAHMVGQDLGALDSCCDWIKIMTYGHALGPAGLPFEMLALTSWLTNRHALKEPEALACVARAARLTLPSTRHELHGHGLPSAALADEVYRARRSGVRHLLAGIELVELKGISSLAPAQIVADLQAIRSARPDGLVLSWDLWHIPLERLDLVRNVWTLDP